MMWPTADSLKHILEGHGFAILEASTGDEALQLFQQEPAVSLILADGMLSGNTGSELAAEIKRINTTIPVVMHSGTPPISMSDIDGFIEKGESSAILVEFVSEFVRRFWA